MRNLILVLLSVASLAAAGLVGGMASPAAGGVRVARGLVSSIAVRPKAVVFGRKVTLAGALASRQSGRSLQILGRQCGASTSTLLGTVTTTTGGAFRLRARPLKQTAYTVRSKNLSSSAAIAKVEPRLRLSRLARHRYLLNVFAAQSFAGKYATFQRYRRAVKRWVSVKRVLLRANGSVSSTLVTSASFRSGIKGRLRVRAVLGQAQVGSCYLAGRSNSIRS